MFPLEARILVADDMPTIRDLVKGHLRKLGFKNIIDAANGEAALLELARHSNAGTPIALVISDWNMPKMTGLEFLKYVRASSEWSQLPFLLLTSESDRDQVTEAILSGVSQYIVKPFTSKTFEEKILAVWQKHNKK